MAVAGAHLHHRLFPSPLSLHISSLRLRDHALVGLVSRLRVVAVHVHNDVILILKGWVGTCDRWTEAHTKEFIKQAQFIKQARFVKPQSLRHQAIEGITW